MELTVILTVGPLVAVTVAPLVVTRTVTHMKRNPPLPLLRFKRHMVILMIMVTPMGTHMTTVILTAIHTEVVTRMVTLMVVTLMAIIRLIENISKIGRTAENFEKRLHHAKA